MYQSVYVCLKMYQDVCARYESAKQIESDLRQQILHLKKARD